MTKTYTFHVHGMHCQSCVLLTQETLKEVPGVASAKTSLKDRRVEVSGDFGDKTPEQVLVELDEVLRPHGYSLSLEKETASVRWADFAFAIPLALLFILGFLFLQRLGIVNLVNTANVSYGTAFVIGLIASVSSCMAVVGGLVLSVSANFAKEGDVIRPQIMFHVGRLVAFFVLGGVIGMLGSVFQLGATGALVLGLVVAVVLIVLGMNLLDIFPWMKRWQLTMPHGWGARVYGVKKANHVLTALILGVLTFFLPCGFTQSMQIYTLTTGTFLRGALTMFVFALGTFPVLALLSFSSLRIHEKKPSGVFFKTAGLVVIFFGLFNLINTLVGAGLIPPVFTF